MKLIIAYIRPERMRDVKTALAKAEISRYAIDNVRTSGDEPSIREQYRGADLYVDTHAMVRFELAVNDAYVEPTIAALTSAGRTEHDADGHILVMNIEHAVRITDGVTAGDALA
ncbi:MAG: P-II family nitrogen regulator [Planctomycetota bacterium]